jgi:hypothetical protein
VYEKRTLPADRDAMCPRQRSQIRHLLIAQLATRNARG